MEQKDELIFHPKRIMLFILLFGLSFLFLALTVSYVYIRVINGVPPVQVPLLFVLNTVVLLASSWAMVQAKKAYLNDETERYQQFLLRTLQLSVVFMVMQMIAWTMLIQNNIYLGSSTTAAFLYVISFVHLVHVVAGIPFLYLFYRAAKKRMVDPVTVLVYFSDPEKQLKLRLLTVYWHFLDFLWVYLVLFFAVNMLI
jgi:cytochrome c oxidase subunit 3